jgi:hypothetical protein
MLPIAALEVLESRQIAQSEDDSSKPIGVRQSKGLGKGGIPDEFLHILATHRFS